MIRNALRHSLAVLLTLAIPYLAHAQPAPTSPSAQGAAVPPLWKMDPLGPSSGILPGSAGGAAYQDRNGTLLVGNSLLDNGPSAPGSLAGIELGIVVPHLSNKLTNPLTQTNGVTALVHLPTAHLDVRAMPQRKLGS